MNKIFEVLRQIMDKDQASTEARQKLLSEDLAVRNEGLINLYIEAQSSNTTNMRLFN